MKRRLILIGCGVVGQGFLRILVDKEEVLRDKYGFEPVLVGVSDMLKGSIMKQEGLDIPSFLAHVEEGGKIDEFPTEGGVTGLSSVETIREAEADIMVEVTYTDIETGEPAATHMFEAFMSRMSVATTNKGPVTLQFEELRKLARENNVQFRFEGVVLSGTPVFNLLEYCLAGNDIIEVKGILNGTTNFMLMKMEEEGMFYRDALALAQELGYAEADPTADVEGFDALAKILMLSNLVLGGDLKPRDVERVGISGISTSDVQMAKSEGKRYKLIGHARKVGRRVIASVKPVKLPLSDPLAGVNGTANALTFKTDLSGEITIQGAGAGKIETGFAVLIDVLNIHREM
ncbi:MAG: homoserine dehydrogenase [Candidatus Proteinoplasmatales archaeon SG8-5]|nr:MAG: homoserine dehydrogenase [Candidatus Proteinoplasmatales archaeon SG8-5]